MYKHKPGIQMDEKGFNTIEDFKGKSLEKITSWEKLDMNFHVIAKIDQDTCIGCGKCFISCEDTSHQSIKVTNGVVQNSYEIIDEECVGCNLCQIVCPVDNCITMVEHRHDDKYLNWIDYQKTNSLDKVIK